MERRIHFTLHKILWSLCLSISNATHTPLHEAYLAIDEYQLARKPRRKLQRRLAKSLADHHSDPCIADIFVSGWLAHQRAGNQEDTIKQAAREWCKENSINVVEENATGF